MMPSTPEQPVASGSLPTTEAFFPREYPTLADVHAKDGVIPLDRFWEKQKFPPWLMAILALFLFFLLFNLVGAVFMVGSLLVQAGSKPIDFTQIEKLLTKDVMGQLLGNTIGQFLGLGVPALLLARGHSSYWKDFLRIRPVAGKVVFWSVLGLVTLYPLIAFSAELNGWFPAPPFVQEMDKLREEFIMGILKESSVWINLLAIALTPAICEEVLFRGYIQRQVERSIAPFWAIVVTGTVFGMYHLSYVQVLPLSLIGIYLCWLTWKTGSILPAVVVHFVNNGFSVVMASTLMGQKDFDPAKMEQIPLPWYGMLPLVVVGILGFWYVSKKIHPNTKAGQPLTAMNTEIPT